MADRDQGTDRDRDASLRPRNARPRDGLGRPLAHDAVGVPRQPEGQRRSPAETLALAGQLFDAGKPFHAHEVFEDAWKAGEDADRELWRGLAQLAVGATHAARGNRRGAVALLTRGAVTISPFAHIGDAAVDVAPILSWADDALGLVATQCPVLLPSPPFRRPGSQGR